MMKPLNRILLTSTLFLFTVAPASAGYYYSTPLFDRYLEQHNKIERSADKGRLTQHQVKRLKRQQSQFINKAANFKKDGELSKDEQRKLHRILDRQEKHLKKMKQENRRQKHHYPSTDNRGRNGYSYRWW